MFCFLEHLPGVDMGNGVLLKSLGSGVNMNVLHWDMADGSTVPAHEHPQEQFGYVIRGGFEMTIGAETAILKAGDSYFIPGGVAHSFKAIGQTEAIDVFSPVREGLPGKQSK